MACELEICSMQAVLIQRLEEDDATRKCEQTVEDDVTKVLPVYLLQNKLLRCWSSVAADKWGKILPEPQQI